MRFAAYRNQGTYAAAYQPRINTVDGQATFFGLERQNRHIRQLFHGYSLRRDYSYRPALPESLRWQVGQARPLGAEKMNRRALAGREKVLGLDHPNTLRSVYCLTYLLDAK